MAGGVIFDEAAGDPMPALKPRVPTMESALLKANIVSTPGGSVMVLAAFAALLIGGSFWFIASAVPPQPTLGGDVLRDGETVPSYVH